MAEKRVMALADTDVVLYADGAKQSLHAAFLRAWDLAKDRVCAAGLEWTDEDGEVHRRRWRIVFGEDLDDLTVKQRGFLHAAVFPQISQQVRFPDGTSYTAQAWKELYREMFLGDRYVMRKKLVLDQVSGRLRPAKRATPHRERVSTEDLNVRQYSDHIDRVIAHATTELGVVFNFNRQEREAARWKQKKRKAAAPARQDAEAATC